MKALTLNDAAVKCDEPDCDWTEKTDTFEDILIWHNVPCPKCNKGIILNDAEFDTINVLDSISKVDVISSNEVLNLHIDSLNLR